jgi:tRNA(Arg) A34 adenosine deaminase TadA
MEEHEALIRETLDLARRAVEKGNHPFGALLWRDGEILLSAENTVVTDRDHTRHAELNLVSMAMRNLNPESIGQITLYTSTEPCPMCSGAIYWAGIPRVVFACSGEALAGLTGGGLRLSCREVFERGERPTEVLGPILEREALAIHREFWS